LGGGRQIAEEASDELERLARDLERIELIQLATGKSGFEVGPRFSHLAFNPLRRIGPWSFRHRDDGEARSVISHAHRQQDLQHPTGGQGPEETVDGLGGRVGGGSNPEQVAGELGVPDFLGRFWNGERASRKGEDPRHGRGQKVGAVPAPREVVRMIDERTVLVDGLGGGVRPL
jgi:hypothetical protein